MTTLVEAWCWQCEAPATVRAGEGSYCDAHDPHGLQLTMTLAEARAAEAWLAAQASPLPWQATMRAALAAALRPREN